MAVLSALSWQRGASVSLGIRGGEISVLIGGSSSRDTEDQDGYTSARERVNASGADNRPESGSGEGGIYGAVGRLVAEAYRNSPPEYPSIARAMGYQGRVTLLLEVMPDGRCGTVDITRSSGYSVLDLAALKAARGWVFFTENSIALASPVRVSQDIIFMLKTY